jgi:hypothetical protein
MPHPDAIVGAIDPEEAPVTHARAPRDGESRLKRILEVWCHFMDPGGRVGRPGPSRDSIHEDASATGRGKRRTKDPMHWSPHPEFPLASNSETVEASARHP